MIRKRRALNTFPPVKTNASLKCTLKIPGIFEQLSDHKIATGPQRQPHRIAKIEQPLARFSPRRDIYIYILDHEGYTMLYNVIHAGPTLNIRIRLLYISTLHTHGFHQPKHHGFRVAQRWPR